MEKVDFNADLVINLQTLDGMEIDLKQGLYVIAPINRRDQGVFYRQERVCGDERNSLLRKYSQG